MAIANLPSPVRGVWHVGVIPVRAYALCIVLAVVVAVWLAGRRYRAAGGEAGVILDVAAWAVPFGLIGARLYSVLTDYQLYFGPHRDWAGIFRDWDGGIPGAIALGALGAWIACRRATIPFAPVAGAAAPAIAIAQAIGRVGNWFDQGLYGRPSSLPWAIQISPAHRVPGYESFTTFQPAFLYEVLWDLLVAALVIWAAHRFTLTGDRAFALYVAAYSVGMFAIQSVRIDYSHHLWGLRIDQWAAILAFAATTIYLYVTHPSHTEDNAPLPTHPATTNPTP